MGFPFGKTCFMMLATVFTLTRTGRADVRAGILAKVAANKRAFAGGDTRRMDPHRSINVVRLETSIAFVVARMAAVSVLSFAKLCANDISFNMFFIAFNFFAMAASKIDNKTSLALFVIAATFKLVTVQG